MDFIFFERTKRTFFELIKKLKNRKTKKEKQTQNNKTTKDKTESRNKKINTQKCLLSFRSTRKSLI